MATLSDVVEELKAQRKDTEKLVSNQELLNKAIQEFISGKTSADRLQEIEDKAEARKPSPFMAEFQRGQQAGEGFNINFGWLLNPMGLLRPLLAGVLAVAGAFAGLRGWELPLLRNIDTVRNILSSISDRFLGIISRASTAISDSLSSVFRPITDSVSRLSTQFASFVDDLVRGTLTRFGINPETGRMARDALGRFTGRETKSTVDMISEATQALRGRVFSLFGLGPAGGLADDVLRAADDAPGVISRVTSAFGRIMTPFRAIYEGVESFISGPGARLFGFLDGVLGISRIGSAAAGLAGTIGKILWPIGIIMSIFDGVTAYQNEEGSQYDKITAGISAAIGDFLGAPLDLIKNLGAWVIGKFGFDETADAIREFNIEESITNLLNGIFDFVGSAVEWVKTLFTNPVEALFQLWNALVGDRGLLGVIGDWLIGFYDWFISSLPDVRELAERLKQQVIDLLPERVQRLIGVDEASAASRRQEEFRDAQEELATLRSREQTFRESDDPIASTLLERNLEAQNELTQRIQALAEELNMNTGTLLSVPSDGIDSLLPPSAQIGSVLRTSDVIDAVRERSAPLVIPVPTQQPAPAPAPSGNGGGGGAFLLPAAPTIDILDAVPTYDSRMYQGL